MLHDLCGSARTEKGGLGDAALPFHPELRVDSVLSDYSSAISAQYGTGLAFKRAGLNEVKNKRNTKEENLAQAEAFRRISGNELDLITLYAADFRKIITDFESNHDGCVPTADDLLWIESEQQGRDVTKG